jgi:hypothetical protein
VNTPKKFRTIQKNFSPKKLPGDLATIWAFHSRVICIEKAASSRIDACSANAGNELVK